MISLVEKLKVNKNFKQFTIDNLKDIDSLSANNIDIINQYYEEHDSIYGYVYKVYDVNSEPHMFVKRENKQELNDDAAHNGYGGMGNWIYELYKLKDKLGDFLLDNIYGLYSKWSFIDHSSRINNLGCTAHGFYVTNNGMLFNSSKEARKYIRDNKMKNSSGKALHPKSLRELFELYEYCEKHYQYQRKSFEALDR